MSHNIDYRSYPENVDRQKVLDDLNHYVAMEDWQEGSGGLLHGIRWYDFTPPCEDYSAAMKFLKKNDKGNYDNLAVRYFVYEQNERGKKRIDAAKTACVDAYRKYQAKEDVLYPTTITSAFVGCKACGSKLSREHLHSNYCPVCRADLRPETTKNAIAAAKKRWKDAQVRVEQAEKANRGRAKHMWLIKFEYHT